MQKLDNQETYKPLRDEKGRLLPGHTANLNGRPSGKTLKEYKASKFREMNDEEKEKWLRENKISGEIQWRMAEGNPKNEAEISGNPELPFILKIVKDDGTKGKNSETIPETI